MGLVNCYSRLLVGDFRELLYSYLAKMKCVVLVIKESLCYAITLKKYLESWHICLWEKSGFD